MCRQRIKLDEELLEGLAQIGCSYDEMSRLLNVSGDTLRYGQKRHFRNIIEKGYANMHMTLRRKQFEVAKSGNCSMLIFLGKVYLKQNENAPQQDNTVFEKLGINEEPKKTTP